MERVEVGLFADGKNDAVVRLPGRLFPERCRRPGGRSAGPRASPCFPAGSDTGLTRNSSSRFVPNSRLEWLLRFSELVNQPLTALGGWLGLWWLLSPLLYRTAQRGGSVWS
ncbi:DUF6959 family protein [Streptomyces sp. 2A115]|uniref:DUF6959 family protein n=1 Tax=Streptomyces sp. 2A115 TaxID=3457439 RepID=UPI003FCEFF70